MQPHLNKIKHIFFVSFQCGHRFTYHCKSPSSFSKMGKRETGWRGGGGLIYLVSGSSHSMTIQPQKRPVALIQGALKQVDEEGVMEVEACEDFLYIMFNPLRQILFILYKCQIDNNIMFSPCAVQNINLKQEKLPHPPPSIPVHKH